jgi:hypothetical protein
VRFSYDDWQTALWNDVNTEVLEDKNKKLFAQLKRFGDSNQIVKGWPVRRGCPVIVCVNACRGACRTRVDVRCCHCGLVR